MRVFRFGLALSVALLSMLTTATAAEFIGVAAALRGEVLRVSTGSDTAATGPVSSGSRIFLGDEIEVAAGGRMQIMLLDETVFTLGSGAKLVIDEFVYDPAAQSGSMTTQITKGAFRFVSGKLAKSSPQAMKVKLPTASISIRGTQVAGIVDEDGSSQVLSDRARTVSAPPSVRSPCRMRLAALILHDRISRHRSFLTNHRQRRSLRLRKPSRPSSKVPVRMPKQKSHPHLASKALRSCPQQIPMVTAFPTGSAAVSSWAQASQPRPSAPVSQVMPPFWMLPLRPCQPQHRMAKMQVTSIQSGSIWEQVRLRCSVAVRNTLVTHR